VVAQSPPPQMHMSEVTRSVIGMTETIPVSFSPKERPQIRWENGAFRRWGRYTRMSEVKIIDAEGQYVPADTRRTLATHGLFGDDRLLGAVRPDGLTREDTQRAGCNSGDSGGPSDGGGFCNIVGD